VAPFVEFMGYTVPWYSIHGVDDPAVGAGLLDDRGFIACYLRDGDRVFLTNEVTLRGVEAIMPMLKLLDMTVYGRQETWEDSPDGWPQPDGPSGWWRRDGRPIDSGPVQAPHQSTATRSTTSTKIASSYDRSG
jgi:predicted dithiol-disulfide oxidoreductase (DUF899 family)